MLKLQLLLLCLCLREICVFSTNSSIVYEDSDSNVNRSISRFYSSNFLWPNATIPYVISTQFNETQKGFVLTAMDKVHNASCVRFVAFNNSQHTDYISIKKHRTQCSSYVGRKGGGQQVVNFANHCFSYGYGQVLHDLLHTIGFLHEHQRPDQSTYVDVFWNNIQNETARLYERRPYGYVQDACEPYDFYSIMHSSMNRSLNVPMLRYKGPGQLKSLNFVGQRLYLSRVDKRKLNRMYNCKTGENGIKVVDETDHDTHRESREILMQFCELEYSAEALDICFRLTAQLHYCPVV